MSWSRIRSAALVAAGAAALSACSTYDYGYGGVSVGFSSGGYCDPYYDDCYGGYGSRYGYGDPWYGWYGDYYYPGYGVYIYDRYRRPHRWSDDHRRYWEGRRGHYQGRNWNDRRWERWDGWDRSDRREWRQDRGEWREGRREMRGNYRDYRQDRQRLHNGDIAREQFRQERREDRQEYREDRRQDRRELRRENRRDRRD